MGKGKIIFKAALSALCFFVFSCNDVLLSSPVSDGKDNSANTASSIAAPSDVVSTHGGIKKINVSWKSVKGAYKYLVFASETPFNEFEQVWETKTTDFTDTLFSGTNRYYKVVAENYAGVRSPYSTISFGSTMANPVITDITMGEEGTSATVKWWMENCDEKTYLNKINYIISVYSQDKTTVVASAYAQSSQNSVLITGLTPKTTYYFEIEAYCTQSQTETETSDKVDAQTARKLIPDAPYDLTVDKGISEKEIYLRWKIPAGVDVKTGSNQYTRNPLYFKVYRKIESAPESDYEEIASYIGTISDGESQARKYRFDCSTQTASDELLQVGLSEDGDSEVVNEGKYVSGSIITFKDTYNLNRGTKYKYKVQSFVDGISKTISSQDSCKEAEGYLIGIPIFKVNADYEKDEANEKFTRISFEFTCSFESYENKYSYGIREIHTDLNKENPQEKITFFSSILDINEKKYEIENFEDEEGYLNFELYILPEGAESIESAYTKISAPGEYIVTQDANLVPKIEEFNVKDGYADKFEISFKYNQNYTYRLLWIPVVNNESLSTQSTELNQSEIEVKEGTAYFSHGAESGDRRIYILEAEHKGITAQKENDNVYETLGTAQIVSSEKEYKNLSFSWKKVQKADTYEVKAFYPDTNTYLTIQDENITENEEIYTCTVENVYGWEDGQTAGKDIKIQVNAKNQTTLAETTGEKISSIMGPALINPQIMAYNSTSIIIKWNKIEEVGGYIIARGRCSDGTSSKVVSVDTYFVSADGKNVLIEGEAVTESRAVLEQQEGFFVLSDNYKETTQTEMSQVSYKKNQSMLCWGLEYQYCIIPVKDEGDFNFSVDQENNTLVLDESSTINYLNLDYVSGSSTGYGLDVEASKAKSGKNITVKWKQPFGCAGLTKTPSVYYRKSKSNAEWVYIAYSLANDDEVLELEITPQSPSESYEFAVVYNTFNVSVTLPNSLEENLTSTMDMNNSPQEQLNKGYAMGLNGIYANYAGEYTEQVSWNPYNFDERKIGPQKYEIQVLNLNDKKGWTTIADIDVDLENNDYGTKAFVTEDYSQKSKIEQVKNGNSILQVKPVFDLSNGNNTSGVLKVLRDYKHYYRLLARRSVENEEDVISSIGDDLSVFGYRQITDEELSKAALLAFSYTFYLNDGGKADYSNATSRLKYGDSGTLSDNYGGTAGFKSGSLMTNISYWGKYSASYSLSGYMPNQLTPGGNAAEFLKLTSGSTSNNGFKIKGLSDYYLYTFDGTNVIEVQGPENLSGMYTATISFEASDEKTLNLSINRNGETKNLVSTTDKETRKQWFPMQISGETRYEITNSSYGWWSENE